jgi:hypothetical protein
MRHFSEHFSEQCVSEQPMVDFVRGIGAPEINRDIRAHLAKGCSKCQTALDAWSRVRRLATEEGAYVPPENLVRMVKLGLASKPAPQPRKWTLANLVFDSLMQPLPMGVRSAALTAWQVVYEAEGLTVDLRFGQRAQTKAVHLVGQVFDKQAVRVLQSNASVELRTEQDQLVATTAVNAMGEFHLEFEQKGHLWLSVKAAGRNIVRIPLANTR